MAQFKELCQLCEALSKVSSRTSKVNLAVDFLRKIDSGEEVAAAVSLILGNLPKAYEQTPLNISHLTLHRTIAKMSRIGEKEFLDEFNQTGDIGETIKRILEKYPPKIQKTLREKPVTCLEVSEVFSRIAEFSGQGSRDKKRKTAGKLSRQGQSVGSKISGEKPDRGNATRLK